MRHPMARAWFSAHERPLDLSRRVWITRTLTILTGLPLASLFSDATAAEEDPDEVKEIAQVQALARQAKLAPFIEKRTKHFLGMGDADAEHCRAAVAICEPLSEAFLAHFRDRGFKLEMPPRRMTVITLKNDASYRAFAGENPGAAVGGHYDLRTNRLVVFDFRDKQEELGAAAGRVNLFTLVHEANHQLCYNTGMLSRDHDVPACISEGLATYAEPWQTRGKGRMGALNRPRLQVLIDARDAADHWIPIADLLTDDTLFGKEDTQQLAYAEAWLLVHYLLKERAQPFRAYLAKIPKEAEAAKRVKCAEAELGSLKALDRAVLHHARGLIRKG